jgi:hypothetical protein
MVQGEFADAGRMAADAVTQRYTSAVVHRS